MMGHIHLYPGRAISGQTIAQERQSFRHIAIIIFDPSATDDPVRTPEGKTLLGCHRNHLIAVVGFLFVGIETRGRTIEELDAALAGPMPIKAAAR